MENVNKFNSLHICEVITEKSGFVNTEFVTIFCIYNYK
jgi:hypothetical protein